MSLSALPPAGDRDHFRAPGPATPKDLRETFGLSADEPLPDLSSLPLSKLLELNKYATAVGTYFDAYPIHVLTTASLTALRSASPGIDFDVRRFRPNVLVATDETERLVENDWPGGTLQTGDLLLRLQARTIRCVMPSRAQPGLKAEPGVSKAVAAHADRHLGAYADVASPAVVKVGHFVRFCAAAPVRRWADERAEDTRRWVLRAVGRWMDR